MVLLDTVFSNKKVDIVDVQMGSHHFFSDTTRWTDGTLGCAAGVGYCYGYKPYKVGYNPDNQGG